MIFCQPAEVNDVWEIVAKATAKNELGIAAKVAPKPVDEDPRKDRLICVYTTDFRDKSDVGRVLQKLRELRLVETRGRPIYYKPGKLAQCNMLGWFTNLEEMHLRTLGYRMAILGASKHRYIVRWISSRPKRIVAAKH